MFVERNCDDHGDIIYLRTSDKKRTIWNIIGSSFIG